MSTIDIGSGATNRSSTMPGLSSTFIDMGNPANDDGVLDSFEVYARSGRDLSGLKVGTFYGSGTDYTNRDYETIGSVTGGSKQTFTGKSCDANVGDYIGCYFSAGLIEYDANDGSGIYRKLDSDTFGAGVQTYLFLPGNVISLYATGIVVSTLSISDGSHAAISDGIALTQVHTLSSADSVHATIADGVVLSQVHAITVGNANHAMTVDGVQFTNVLCVLPTADTSHAMTVDNAVIAENITLSPAAAAHAHTADGNLSINQYMAVMSHDSGHALTSANVSLTQAHDLVVADATHALTNGAVGFLQFHTLTAADAAHATTAEGVNVTEDYTLSTADAVHLHTADGDLALSQVNIVYPDDSEHALISDNITLFQFIYGAHVRVARSYRG